MSTARTGRMTSGIAAVVAAAAVLILLSVFMPSFSYASSTCSIQIDGVTIPSDADPIVEDGTTLVPIGVISGYLGGTSDWNSQTETATVKNGDVTIVMTIGSTTATVNGEKKTLTLAPRITTVNEQGRRKDYGSAAIHRRGFRLRCGLGCGYENGSDQYDRCIGGAGGGADGRTVRGTVR